MLMQKCLSFSKVFLKCPALFEKNELGSIYRNTSFEIFMMQISEKSDYYA